MRKTMNFGERRRLPDRRPTSTFGIVHRGKNGQERGYTISVGFFDREECEPAEIFVTGPKVGSELETVARDCAILWSVARQYGAPVDVLAHALTQEQDGTPSTVIGLIAGLLQKYTLETKRE
jgi:hypothetical protein